MVNLTSDYPVDPSTIIDDGYLGRKGEVPRILVVDDEPQVATLFRLLLEKGGHKVTVESSSETAIERLEQQKFDLVLLDLNLRPGDGFEVLRHARYRMPNLKIIAISGEDDTILEAAGQLGAIATLHKPVTPEQLTFTVTRLFGISSASSSKE